MDDLERLDEILNRNYINQKALALVKKYEPDDHNNSLFISKQDPAIITKGNKQLVLRIGDELACKAASYFNLNDYYQICNDRASKQYQCNIRETLEFLKEHAGIDLTVRYVDFKYEDEKFKTFYTDGESPFILVPDLTRNGKRIVLELLPEENLSIYINSIQVLEEYGKIKQVIDLWHSLQKGNYLGWRADKDGHMNLTPEEAIRKMFFLTIDAKNCEGNIEFADFNHVLFSKYPKKISQDKLF